MTTETRIIVRAAPDALRAVGPIKPFADAPTPSDMEEKPPAPASKKHSGDPEVAKAASASKKPANDMKEAKETQASEKHAKDAGEAKKLPASKKPANDMKEAKETQASEKHAKDAGEAKKLPASMKPANDMKEAKETQASEKHAKDAGEAKKLPASKKPKVAATKAKVKAKTPASPKPTRKAKKVTASSKPAPKKPVVKKPVVKKPAAKQLPKTKGSSKEGQKTLKLPPKCSAVLLPGPHEDVSSYSSDTDIPNPGYVSGADSPAPRARASTKDHAASSKDATTTPPGRSPSPSLEVDYEESEPDIGHEDGEVEWSPKRTTDAQRVLHPGSPMSPKTVVAVECARLLETSMSRQDDPPAAVSEPQVITIAGVDEGVPPELLQPDNRQHLADRTHQEASQAVGTKRDRETHAPRTQEQLLALRYWTRDEYREHLRQSRMPGPCAP
ncbi:hypothetical protein PF005_g10462 [Phytophthora fragariae]|nr:hypothetical protein PF003_g15065 [Phytophthora fragariae]KAE8929267.1 hypothetical protein PF009_g20604 [Phytophthora fragariae]KAE9120047.1 hypothetical protein PF006_g18227 [Phytophthora fragariae]KAE9203873.1 hypothetical protein PF002_g20797 [Phytophthora fragariae]KAE9212759.1 hypothetical protein PF005_g10462 [Phytophthora fragariae]